MEETVGKLWDRWIRRLARSEHPHAAVRLDDVRLTVGIVFRALGGDGGLRVGAAAARRHGARRRLLNRLSGTAETAVLASLDDTVLRLPATIDLFADRALNSDLYLWLAALAATAGGGAAGPNPFLRNQHAARRTLQVWPGLAGRYGRLVAAHLAQRLPVARLPPAERAREVAIRVALVHPGSVAELPAAPVPAGPVPLWLWSFGAATESSARDVAPATDEAAGAPAPAEQEAGAYAAERVEYAQQRDGMLLQFRAESLLSMGEYVRVNRSEDDDPDAHPAAAARDLDHLALAADGQRAASRVRFDLDLPSAAADDLVLGAGIPLPEWDYRDRRLLPDHVRLIEMSPRDATPAPLPAHLLRTARRLQRQFAALRPARQWIKAQPDGSELDVDAVVRAATDRACGVQPADKLFQTLERRQRDLACLVLADLSLSTDAWVTSDARVVDVVRDALLLFGEAMAAAGDRFALCGFSSVRRNHVRFLRLKDFSSTFSPAERGRVLAVKPGYYTRLGAAIRHGANLLGRQPTGRRLLLLLSDGKPNDLDLYEGRYGIEDTRMAVLSARQQGIRSFCVTIDREGQSYLPHLFGPNGFVVIRRPGELPQRLPRLYAELTR